MKQSHKFFLPGQRIARTAAAVMLCMLIYEVRGRRGMPIFALIAAVMCIQPYIKDIRAIAQRRIIGTIIGAAFGVIALLAEQAAFGWQEPGGIIHYIIAALGTGIVIYFAVWLNLANMAQFAGIVFLIVVITQAGSENVFLYAYHRIIDTLIGITVGELVNRIHLPRIHNTDTLFASGITNTIFGDGKKLTGYSLFELNRLIEDGCKFTVDTIETPASIRELLHDVDFRLPIIAMDGAVLYDMKEREYLKVIFMEREAVSGTYSLLNELGVEFFMTTLDQQMLIIRHGELRNEAIREHYSRKRVSPYRNYAQRISESDYLDKTIYFFLLDREDAVEKALKEIRTASWSDKIRIKRDERHIPDGYMCVRIFPAAATKESMLAVLKELSGASETVTFGSEKGHCDVYVENSDKDLMVKELKRRFEPVSLKGWRNIFSLH